MNTDRLERNLAEVRKRIAAACERAGRNSADVRLVAVTKTATPEAVRALVELGVTDLGENRIQEAAKKRDALAGLNVRWHMIGHLQTNKVREAVEMFDLIHSVDSVRVAEALDARASSQGRTVPVLMQVNVSGEATKHGIPAALAIDELRKIAKFGSIQVEGLMTMAPFVDDAEEVRSVFTRLRQLAAQIKTFGMPGGGMKHLSMGMTQDYEVAVEEGATIVRIGTALFTGV